jgi:hypothetical protein
MASIPLPALAVQPPAQQTNPIEEFARIAQIKGLQADLETRQLQNQQLAMASMDDQKWRQAIADSNGDPDQMLNLGLKYGVGPKSYMAMQSAITEHQKQLTSLRTDQLALLDKFHDNAIGMLQPIVQSKNLNLDQKQQAWADGIGQAEQQGWLIPGSVTTTYPGDDSANLLLSKLKLASSQIKDAKDQAEARKANAGATLDEIKANISKNSKPGDFDNIIDQAAPPNGPDAALNQRTKNLVNFSLLRGDTDSANRAITEMSNQLGAVEKETNPQVQAGKVAVATAEGQARANIEAQMARGSNAALANVPPHLVSAATADATKAGTEFAAAQSVSQRLNAMMDAARRGNVIAYQVIPEEGTLQITTSQGVHRINKTEIDQYAGGGSAWDRLVGHVGKQLTGQSIPGNVLDDMAEIQKIQAEGARSKYENSLKVINQSYGSTFKPVDIGQNATTTAPTPQSHDFSLSAWQRANPGGNAAAAKAAAIQQGFRVVP